jgi:uncharacterized membrane protein
MKNLKLITFVIPFSLLMTNCKTVKEGTSEYVPIEKQLTYDNDIKPIITTSCTPCHIPPQGRKEPLDSYEHVKENIVAIIERINLPQDNRKFMPPINKKPALTDDQVAVLVKWQQQNMPQ